MSYLEMPISQRYWESFGYSHVWPGPPSPPQHRHFVSSKLQLPSSRWQLLCHLAAPLQPEVVKNIFDAINKKDQKTFRRKDPVHTVKIFSALAAITPRSETSRPFLSIKIRSFQKEDVDLLTLDIFYIWMIIYLKTFLFSTIICEYLQTSSIPCPPGITKQERGAILRK